VNALSLALLEQLIGVAAAAADENVPAVVLTSARVISVD
jgi:hypothetical protein